MEINNLYLNPENRDGLTGLFNRDYIINIESKREGIKGIIVIDIDGLKGINDSYSYKEGDKLIKSIGGIIKSSIPKSFIPGRLDGDEFIIICDIMESILSVIKKIKEKTKEYLIQGKSINISIGYKLASFNSNFREIYNGAYDNMLLCKLKNQKSGRGSIIKLLDRLILERDSITEKHSDRASKIALKFGKKLNLSDENIWKLSLLTKFHDIGKIGIKDSILFKNGSLTLEERKEIENHSIIGYRIAMSSRELSPIGEYILTHHEWWNGKGYPLSLKGKNIPYISRILAIADAYEAMTSDRPYRKSIGKEGAIEELKKYSGSQFDPYLILAFIEMIK